MNQNLLELLEIVEASRQLYDIIKMCPYEILREFRVGHYKAGEFHLRQGSVYDTLYIIVSGSAEIYVEAANGKRYRLSTYGKGQIIGEMEVFRRVPYVSSVIADKEIVLIEIGRSTLLRWLDLDKNFAEFLIRGLSDEAYDMCRNMSENTLYSLKQRVCQYFLSKADAKGNFRTEVRTENLGELLAVTQRSVNRILKELRDKELIAMDKKGVHILDLEGLQMEMEDAKLL